ncbi:hypothetical protein [Paenibacillus physcomitrellae]|uniref:Uncharacterized protein n=1 Tax=Paenibacillus physcomitrellae TaxID=1619311 RepID=A0ABQ1FYV8_9BACL|nr:hypothetical protein [Paenibacillus physcomitrellae]GGA32598.1 hypothetical protein GCM10010917_17130 [Paenibacillus physcomitrellae]
MKSTIKCVSPLKDDQKRRKVVEDVDNSRKIEGLAAIKAKMENIWNFQINLIAPIDSISLN